MRYIRHEYLAATTKLNKSESELSQEIVVGKQDAFRMIFQVLQLAECLAFGFLSSARLSRNHSPETKLSLVSAILISNIKLSVDWIIQTDG